MVAEGLDWEVNGDGPLAQWLAEATIGMSGRHRPFQRTTNHTNATNTNGWPTKAKDNGDLARPMPQLGPDTSPETYAVIGACFEVHNELGPGYLESAYGDALELEFSDRGITALREVPLHVTYKGRDLRTRYRADFLVNGRILVELKSQTALTPIDEAQVIHYLKTMGIRVALLVNFGAKSCEVRRFVGPEVPGQDIVVEFV